MIISRAERLNSVKEYYFSVKLQEVRELMAQGKPVINIGIGNPDQKPSEAAIEALQTAAQKPDAHGYQPYRGIEPLRKAMANWYYRVYGVQLDQDQEILPLLGSKEGITHISLAFLNPGDQVLVPELGYPAYRSVSEMIGAKAVNFPMNERSWEPDFDALEKMDLSGVKMMWVNYPNMPTGKQASEELFEKLVNFGLKHKILICHDNPYSMILPHSNPISILAVEGAKEVAIELNSMSKSHNMAGWRIGWINGGADYLNEIIKIKSNVDSGMFKPLQEAAVAALGNTDEWHQKQNEIYANRKLLMEEVLKQLDCHWDQNQTGMFIWAKIPDQVKEVEQLVDHLLHEHSVFLSPGFIFGDKGKRYIRVSLCTHENQIKEVIERLKTFDINKLN
ncbi:pyridoxal phosphate-dependent aminotransferase [Persicobacter sp. CCB-QB2]|uniref:pyridoxal phosphate-dependent aminotransferase n=1 Tax=Persicobacter sp. CCB-QB2 TaxID=1561025 RepID=UPI0006A97DB4|nr:aminotransferase class I/II-fold pyridoxal phosphate-dependent enzyme [Persicobacter sp. CCB-QB2]